MTDWISRFAGATTSLGLLAPTRLWTAGEALGRTGAAPRRSGIYAWYFDCVPGAVDASGCHQFEDRFLLYVGISPSEPPTNGKPPSKSNLAKRLRHHFGGNAAGSTLRKTLGCLLEAEIGVMLRRVGSGERYTFTNPGEQKLDAWLHAHARVTWVEHPAPWIPERVILVSGLPLPLNIDENPCEAFTIPLKALRKSARQRAGTLPIVADNGGPRRSIR